MQYNTRVLTKKIIILVVYILLFLLVLIGLIYRIHYAIDFSDESWYVAEPYAVAMLGSRPFIDNISQSPGFTIPLALLFKIYCIITGSAEGIVLFSRYIYLFLSAIIAVTTWLIVRFRADFNIPFIAVPAMMIGGIICSLFDVSYNTVGVIYYPLIMALVFADYKSDRKQQIIWGIFAGILAVRATMGTLQIIVGLTVVFVYLCICKKKERILGILIGCISACIVLLVYICVQSGIGAFFSWIKMFIHLGYFSVERIQSILDTTIEFFKFLETSLWMIMLMGVAKFVCKKYSQLFEIVFLAVIIISIYNGIAVSFEEGDYMGNSFAEYTLGIPYLFLFQRGKYRHSPFVMITSLSYLCIFIFATFTNVYGFGFPRTYWLVVPFILALGLLLNREDGNNLVLDKPMLCSMFCTIMLLGFIALKGWYVYSYVYRDDSISNLKTQIDEGVWKGIYTTEKRAQAVVELEKYIKSVTSNADDILCLDWCSFGYLMINGNMCAPSVLDNGAYTYNVNNPIIYYEYYDIIEKIPNKIIYIDYGRDEVLSIECDNWQFNEFVDSYYYLEDTFENRLFAVREYDLKDAEGAKKMIKEKLSAVQEVY